MFLTKKERIKICVESIIYVLLVVLTSYFTIFGSHIIRMIPVLYLLGIIGRCVFKKTTLTTILGIISILVLGFIIKGGVDSSLIFLAIYTGIMILCGCAVGYSLSELYSNYKLKKFLKYYVKIKLIVITITLIVVPFTINAFINGNVFSYNIAKRGLKRFCSSKYDSPSFNIHDAKYVPHWLNGKYIFTTHIDDTEILLCYYKGKVTDINMDSRVKIVTGELNNNISKLYEKNLISKDLDIVAKAKFSEITVWPNDIIFVIEAKDNDIQGVVQAIKTLKAESWFNIITRIDIVVGEKSVSISGEDLNKEIVDEYIKRGMVQEILDTEEDGKNE